MTTSQHKTFKMLLVKNEKVTRVDVVAASYPEAVARITAKMPDVLVACLNGGAWSERER